jgi:hypothetical protein
LLFSGSTSSKHRNIGRPLAAGPRQVKDVRERRKAGQSIRSIALDTNLSEGTVRTIIGKAEGTDRATLARLERIARRPGQRSSRNGAKPTTAGSWRSR